MHRRTAVELHELVDEETYEAAVAKCTGVTGFHRWFFLDALASALRHRFRAFEIDVNGECVGVLPVLLHRRGPFCTVNYLPVPYVGPLVRDKLLLPDALRAIDPYLFRQGTVVTKWSFAPAVSVDSGMFAKLGFSTSLEENYVVPADRSPEQHLAIISPKKRAAIRRGKNSGMSSSPSTRQEITDWFPLHVTEPYRRQGLAPDYTQRVARHMAERLASDPRMLWRSIYIGDQILAINASIVDVNRVWGWLLVGERREGPSPHVAAYWDAIEWSLNQGLACNFGGAPTKGIRDFKMEMGGVMELGLSAERVFPKVYRSARALHARLRRMRPPDRSE